MSECDRLLERIFERDLAGDIRVERHASRCARCREQLNAERELRQLFEGVARPGLSLHFSRELRERLRAERRRQRRQGWRLCVMQAYWIAASLASAVVVMLIRWPSELPSVPVLSVLGAVLGLALLTPLILFRVLSISPLGLILGTMEEFRR